MAIINCVNGKEILIDEADLEKAQKYSWYWRKNGRVEYAISYVWSDGRKKWFYIHQLIMGTIGTKKEVDHKDHNGLNNQRDNLSIVSHSDSIKNRRKHRGTSRYWGVSKHSNKWIAHINIEGKCKHLGLFAKEIDAARAYNKAALATGNNYYRLNDIH